MNKLTNIKSVVAVLDYENIDTDQIIGSDHLKITNKEGLGKHLFSDWRYRNDGKLNPEFILNKTKTKSAKILVTGDNFGCGSSREHAPWALVDFGIQVVISSSIADIFFNNAVKNGLLAIKVTREQLNYLKGKNACEIEVDIIKSQIICLDKIIYFKLEPFARYCLINGIDQLDFLLSHTQEIDRYEMDRHESVNDERIVLQTVSR